MIQPIFFNRLIELFDVFTRLGLNHLFRKFLFIRIRFQVSRIRKKNTTADHTMIHCLKHNLIKDVLENGCVFKSIAAIPTNRGVMRHRIR
jgi:hypothetical protein